jgi:branched-chain amino acid transport system ATP-binding protein
VDGQLDSGTVANTLTGIATTLLSVQDVSIRFGGIVALDGVSFDVSEGTILGLIGPNGAGKTTMFNCITRMYTPNSGRILLDGGDLLRSARHEIVGRGLTRTFQNVELFTRMTVLDNVLCGLHVELGAHPLHFLAAGFGWPGVAASERRARGRAMEALELVGLGQVANRPVAGLPFGTLKAVELARALVSRPRLLLLDEPAGGLNHDEVGGLADLIRRIHRDLGLTLLVVEHHMNLVMGISDRVVVLDFGRKIAEGTPREVRENAVVIDAYLGAETDGAA